MIYQMIPKINQDDQQVFARIDDDGKSRLSSIAQNEQFKADLANGVELQDADGNPMTADQIKTFLEGLA